MNNGYLLSCKVGVPSTSLSECVICWGLLR